MPEKWVALEEKGRELASVTNYKNDKWVEQVSDLFADMYNELKSEEEYAEKIPFMLDYIYDLSEILKLYGSYKENDQKSYAMSINNLEESAEDIKAHLGDVDDSASKIIGSPCSWLTQTGRKYTPRAAVNDVTACFHQAKLLLSQAESMETKGKCSRTKDANPKLWSACEEWDNITAWLHNSARLDNGGIFIIPHDFDSLKGFVFDNKLQLRVGSSAGHLSHVNLENGTVSYYDTDENINEYMSQILSKSGLECLPMENDDGITCTGVDESNVLDVVRDLSLATSADIRQNSRTSACADKLVKERKKAFADFISQTRNNLRQYMSNIEYDPSKTLEDNLTDNGINYMVINGNYNFPGGELKKTGNEYWFEPAGKVDTGSGINIVRTVLDIAGCDIKICPDNPETLFKVMAGIKFVWNNIENIEKEFEAASLDAFSECRYNPEIIKEGTTEDLTILENALKVLNLR